MKGNTLLKNTVLLSIGTLFAKGLSAALKKVQVIFEHGETQ